MSGTRTRRAFRIAGAVRGLSRAGQTSVDFADLEMSGLSFRRHDISEHRGVNLLRRRVGIARQPGEPAQGCRFEEADLKGATFKGALLAWTEDAGGDGICGRDTGREPFGWRSTVGRSSTPTSPGRPSMRWRSERDSWRP